MTHDATQTMPPSRPIWARTRVRPLVLVLALAAIVLTGCSSDPKTDFPEGSISVIANADIGTGHSRILIGVVGPDGARLGSPETLLSVVVAPASRPEDTITIQPVWTWIIEDVIGLWRAELELDEAGRWLLAVVPEEGPAPAIAQFLVNEQTAAPGIGDPAPSLPTPTVSSGPIESITSDQEPDLRFYQTSLDQAIASGRQTVVVFATPAFCSSAACGPLLDITKEVATDFPDVEFIHVEVYLGINEPDFVPDGNHLAPAMGPDFWNLPSEPWVFVIDKSGLVSARFEGVMAGAELRKALG